jgi:uncharacterized membrane protein SpoIIM required for sporulation
MNLIQNCKYKKYVIIHTLIFIFGIIVGVMLGNVIGDIGEIPILSKPFYDYFIHNLITCITIILFGVITFGFLTWIPLIYNGVILGMAINFLSYHNDSFQILIYFAHGFVEIPSLMLSIYLGKLISMNIREALIALIKKKKFAINSSFFKEIGIMFSIITGLLLLASIIEALPK